MGGERARRLFTAVAIPGALAEEVLGRVKAGVPESGFRFPRPDGLHLTLHFLGDVEPGRIDALCRALERSLVRIPGPVDARLAGTGAFPRRGEERVLWAGVEARSGALEDLLAAALVGAEEAGFDVAEHRSRPFRPHVTVARPRGAARAPETFWSLDLSGTFRVEAVTLFESVPSERGPNRYVALRDFGLVRGDVEK